MKVAFVAAIAVIVFASLVAARPFTPPARFLSLATERARLGTNYKSSGADTASSSSSTSKHVAEYNIFWFNQTLDHFNFQQKGNPNTFSQRYLVNDKNWVAGAPIWFYTGNEGDVEDFANNTGFMFEHGPAFNAMIVFAEHRYYGESLPFGNNSFSGNNVGFLTSEQALADYANLLTWLKQNTPGAENSPVVGFGGSYGGMLAAWFRMKYPNIVIGSLAASAPILQFTGLTNEYIFEELTTEDFTNVDPQCSANIRESWDLIMSVAQESDGFTKLSQYFSLCSPVKNMNDVYTLMDWANTAFTYMAMVDYPYPANFLQPMPGYPVNVSCAAVTANTSSSTADVLTAFAQGAGVYYNGTGEEMCFNFSQSMSADLGADSGWDYQACTEMVMPIAANGVTDMFPPSPWDLSAYVDYCYETYGAVAQPNWIPLHYGGGGRNITAASNIIFSNGDLDPWRGGGVTHTLSDSLIAIVIEGGAHHLDLRFSNPLDPPAVTAARDLELDIITSWLDEYYAGSGASPSSSSH